MPGVRPGFVSWSRLHPDRETVVAINTDSKRSAVAWVTVDGTIIWAGEITRYAFGTGGLQPCKVRVELRNGHQLHQAASQCIG